MNFARMALVTALVAATLGCTVNDKARVFVNYDQVANFYEYLLSADSTLTHGAGDGRFIMFKVTQINNTGAEAKTFVFNVNNVSTVAPDQTSNEAVTDAGVLLAAQNVTTVTVPAGQVVSVNRCFIKNALTGNSQALTSAQVPLIYAGTSDQPVTMNNIDPGGSVTALGDALPNTLVNLCSGN